MKPYFLALCAAVALLASCNPNPPAKEQPAAGTEQPTPEQPAADTTATATSPVPATAPAAPAGQTLKMSFDFKPAEADAGVPKTSVHLLLKGSNPQDIDLGRFTGKPDLVDEAKAKRGGFPAGMLLGFRSYHAGSGTGTDLAVMNVGGTKLRILQRRIDEAAEETPTFQTAREIPLPANTVVEVAAKK